MSQQAQRACAGKVEECCPTRPREQQVLGGQRSVVPPGPDSRCWEGGVVFLSNRPREQVLGGRRSAVPQALRAGAGRVEESCPNKPREQVLGG